MTKKYVPMLKTIEVEGYRKLVAMMAWKAWRKLPLQTRIWIGIEDMIEDGVMEAVKLTRTYNPKWALFTTALYHRLHHFYINNYLEFYSAQQRGWERVNVIRDGKKTSEVWPIPHQSLDALKDSYLHPKYGPDAQNRSHAQEVEGAIPSLVVYPDSIVQNTINHCFVIPTLEKIYYASSPKMQVEIIKWFFSEDKSRVHKKGRPFKKYSHEFREMAMHYRLTCEDCIHVVRSPGCLDLLSRDLLHVPYSLEYPTPLLERVI